VSTQRPVRTRPVRTHVSRWHHGHMQNGMKQHGGMRFDCDCWLQFNRRPTWTREVLKHTWLCVPSLLLLLVTTRVTGWLVVDWLTHSIRLAFRSFLVLADVWSVCQLSHQPALPRGRAQRILCMPPWDDCGRCCCCCFFCLLHLLASFAAPLQSILNDAVPCKPQQ